MITPKAPLSEATSHKFCKWWEGDKQDKIREKEKQRVDKVIADMKDSIKRCNKTIPTIDFDGTEYILKLRKNIAYCTECILQLQQLETPSILAYKNAKGEIGIIPAYMHPPYYKMWREQDK